MKPKRLYALIIVVALLSVSLSYTAWSVDTSPPLMPVRTSNVTFVHQFAYYRGQLYPSVSFLNVTYGKSEISYVFLMQAAPDILRKGTDYSLGLYIMVLNQSLSFPVSAITFTISDIQLYQNGTVSGASFPGYAFSLNSDRVLFWIASYSPSFSFSCGNYSVSYSFLLTPTVFVGPYHFQLSSSLVKKSFEGPTPPIPIGYC